MKVKTTLQYEFIVRSFPETKLSDNFSYTQLLVCIIWNSRFARCQQSIYDSINGCQRPVVVTPTFRTNLVWWSTEKIKVSNIWTSLNFHTVLRQFYYEYAVLLSILSRGPKIYTFERQSMISDIVFERL